MKDRAWLVYILNCSDGSYYVGCTNNLPKRIQQHKCGTGSKYVRSRLPFSVVYISGFLKDRSSAQKLEAMWKKKNHMKKQEDIQKFGFNSLLRTLSGEL